MDAKKKASELLEVVAQSWSYTNHCMADFNTGGLAIVSYLNLNHDGATPTELREFLHMGSGGIANALKELEKKELVERRTDANDKRSSAVYITEKGKALANENCLLVHEKLTILCEAIGEEDADALIRILKKVCVLQEVSKC